MPQSSNGLDRRATDLAGFIHVIANGRCILLVQEFLDLRPALRVDLDEVHGVRGAQFDDAQDIPLGRGDGLDVGAVDTVRILLLQGFLEGVGQGVEGADQALHGVVAHMSRTYANISGATIVASLSMMNFGVSMSNLPQVIFSLGTAPL